MAKVSNSFVRKYFTKTLTNMIPYTNFGLSGVTRASNGEYTFSTGGLAMITAGLPAPVLGHKYYGRCYQLAGSGFSCADGRFEYFGGDGTGKNEVFTSAGECPTDGQWHRFSRIVEFPSISGSGWTMRSFTVNGTTTFRRKMMMIIDLTAEFGAGAEPDLATCDACIADSEASTSTFNGLAWAIFDPTRDLKYCRSGGLWSAPSYLSVYRNGSWTNI